jgi:hypothetical protein
VDDQPAAPRPIWDSLRIAFIGGHFWFHSKPHRAKCENQFPRLDSEAIRLVALAKEQLALITENWFHNFPFVEVKNWRMV